MTDDLRPLLLAHLRRFSGEGRTYTKTDLAAHFGCTTREAELCINALRLEGEPIVSSGRGYWYTESPAVVKECASRLRVRAAHQLQVASMLDATGDRMLRSLAIEPDGQARMFAGAATGKREAG